ncbi:hypothetical protein ACVWY0_004428 [Arthrobacter sp. UYNi723]
MTQDEVRGRIQAFVADFHTRWQRSGKSPGMFAFDPGVFEAWAAELADLVATHCTPGVRTGQEGALSSSPAHHPSAEQITDVEVDEDTATVRHLGKLTCASGVLTVLDLGSVDAHFLPLARRIMPGTYAVEVATAAEMTVAVRLLLSEAPAVSWHPAEFTDGTHGVGVDAGNVAILDVGSLVECQAQRVEAMFQEHVERLMETPGTMFGLAGEVVDAVMVSSGYGDGTYPCYWGLAADGGLTSLVIDFRVLAENILRTSRVPFQPGPVSRTWNPDAPPPPGSVLEVTEYLEYRHI